MNSDIIDMEIVTLELLAPAGFYVGINLAFSAPMATYIRFPSEWVLNYTKKSLFLSDPALQWCLANEGAILWSEINLPDPKHVLPLYSEYGLNNGASVSVVVNGIRSIGLFSRADRAYEENDLSLLENSLKKLHMSYHPDDILTALEAKSLFLLTKGNTLSEVALVLGVSTQVVNTRMMTIRRKLSVKTNVEAVVLAMKLHLFNDMEDL